MPTIEGRTEQLSAAGKNFEILETEEFSAFPWAVLFVLETNHTCTSPKLGSLPTLL